MEALKHILDISHVFFRHIPAFFWLYLGHISPITLTTNCHLYSLVPPHFWPHLHVCQLGWPIKEVILRVLNSLKYLLDMAAAQAE